MFFFLIFLAILHLFLFIFNFFPKSMIIYFNIEIVENNMIMLHLPLLLLNYELNDNIYIKRFIFIPYVHLIINNSFLVSSVFFYHFLFPIFTYTKPLLFNFFIIKT